MKVLVTGGSGFLGSHVADVLSDCGHQVTILDIKESPYLMKNQTMVIGDILDEKLLHKCVQDQDIVYHFAALADLNECVDRPADTVKFNILGTVNLLEACCKNDIQRFVFASTAYVYSQSGYFYRASKQAAENYIEVYSELYGLHYTILRYGSLYGPRADDRNSIHRLIKQALSEKKIKYHGTGEEIREFIHVHDAAEASVNILEEDYLNKNLMITGIDSMRYKDILEMIREMLNNKVEIEIVPSDRKAHYMVTPYNFVPKSGKKLTVNPHKDLGQGILECMQDIYHEINSDNP